MAEKINAVTRMPAHGFLKSLINNLCSTPRKNNSSPMPANTATKTRFSKRSCRVCLLSIKPICFAVDSSIAFIHFPMAVVSGINWLLIVPVQSTKGRATISIIKPKIIYNGLAEVIPNIALALDHRNVQKGIRE